MIPFKETCLNKQLNDKVRKEKIEYEETNDQSSSTSEEEVYDETLAEENKDMTLNEFIEMQRKHELAREDLKKEQTEADMYLEKIHLNKVYRDNPKEMERLGYYRGNAHDVTAN